MVEISGAGVLKCKSCGKIHYRNVAIGELCDDCEKTSDNTNYAKDVKE